MVTRQIIYKWDMKEIKRMVETKENINFDTIEFKDNEFIGYTEKK